MGTVYVDSISHLDRVSLVERFQGGDLVAFNEIVNRCQKHVYNLAYGFTHNYEDAYDISQEVFIKVFRSLSKLKKSSAFDSWLKRVTVNACVDYLRRRPNEQVFDDFSRLDHKCITSKNSELPNRPVENDELQDVISKAVRQLSRQQRNVFILRHYEGLSLKEIAEKLNCSLGTIKAHLFRATRRLRKLLSPYIS